MTALRKHFKLIVLILCVPFFVQSCTVYKSTGVSIYEAAKSESKVKIIKKDGKNEKFAKVELFDDGQIYGKKKIGARGEFNNVLIDTSTVKKVQLYDKKNSTIKSIVLPVVIIGVIFAAREVILNSISVGL